MPAAATPLLDATVARLVEHPATRGIPRKLAESATGRERAERVCRLVEGTCAARGLTYASAVEDFIVASSDFLARQLKLERTGRYACASYEEARRTVYDNPSVMATTYLHGLLLSHALWPNHARLFQVFSEQFCAKAPRSGRVLEVPVGTGLYLAEFARQNPAWTGLGVDISVAAADFARSLLRIAAAPDVEVRQKDVFELRDAAGFDRIICGELLEHLESPERLLEKLRSLLAKDGRVFLTTAIWAESPDHVYLFESAAEVRAMLSDWFEIVAEWVLPLEDDASPDMSQIPINYGCVLRAPPSHP